MVLVSKREFVVVESCFEVIFHHADVVTRSSGCCRDCHFVDDVVNAEGPFFTISQF